MTLRRRKSEARERFLNSSEYARSNKNYLVTRSHLFIYLAPTVHPRSSSSFASLFHPFLACVVDRSNHRHLLNPLARARVALECPPPRCSFRASSMSFLDPRGGTRARASTTTRESSTTRVHGASVRASQTGRAATAAPARTPSMGARDDVRCVRGHRVRRRVRALRGDETAKTGSHGERDSKETQIMDADDQRYHAARDAVGKFRLGV